ncbi:probable disease resistance protein At1g59620 [Neltuma alba]|uniref:probable disease resistance protein At1g59620 n=1 Tax=Neltuma alba TaxID=207710 RepID=UPI0010A43A7E|nr:probable disease resistance protein At1g59620 [Prosopis alba]
MGGIGKTTLFQLVYNEGDENKKFDCKAWACVFENFNLLKILQTILSQSNPVSVCDKAQDLNILQLRLVENLARKRFFVVLDGVWNIKYTDRDTLKNLLDNGVKGRDVASKCKGLPLAAKVLLGLFQSVPDIERRNSILKDNIWDFDRLSVLQGVLDSDVEGRRFSAAEEKYEFIRSLSSLEIVPDSIDIDAGPMSQFEAVGRQYARSFKPVLFGLVFSQALKDYLIH